MHAELKCRSEMPYIIRTILHENAVLNTYLEGEYNYCYPHTQQNSKSYKKPVTEFSND
jgi:hypothetical protein